MDYLLVCGLSFLVAAVTLFSGFGLGSVLMPVFALFFPVTLAVAATAVVHLANNIFKVGLVGRHADWTVVRRFGLPAALAAFGGAAALHLFARFPPLVIYDFLGRSHSVTMIGLVVGSLIVCFALYDLLPRRQGFLLARRYLAAGGLLSGFFGGLSGNQGALRSAFLINMGLSREAFVGTGTVIAVLVDISRLVVYGTGSLTIPAAGGTGVGPLVAAATGAAFAGSFLGKQYLKKITLHSLQVLVGILLILLGAGMAAGLF